MLMRRGLHTILISVVAMWSLLGSSAAACTCRGDYHHELHILDHCDHVGHPSHDTDEHADDLAEPCLSDASDCLCSVDGRLAADGAKTSKLSRPALLTPRRDITLETIGHITARFPTAGDTRTDY